MNERDIFLAALEIDKVEERAAYLDAACQGRPELRKRVEALFQADRDAGSFLNRPAVAAPMQAAVAAPAARAAVAPGREAPPADASARSSQRLDQEDTARSRVAGPVQPPASGGAPVPQQFGRYRILKLLGQGGMGAVYLARDTMLDRDVALKMPQLGGQGGGQDISSEIVERFYREARAAGNLHHPNICAVYDVGAIDGRHYLTMRYIEGRPLTKFISPDRPQNPRNVAVVIRKLASALEEAHRHGVVHRDLKPANVMMDAKNEPVVMDFGLARQMNSRKELQLTQSGMIVGTPSYMSPEQISGDPQRIGPQTDIWSLGVILFEMLTARLPFDGNIMEVIAAIQRDDAPPPSQIRSSVPPKLDAICRKMLARDVAQRYQTMGEVASDLNAFLKEKPGEAGAGSSVLTPIAGMPSESRGAPSVDSPAGSLPLFLLTESPPAPRIPKRSQPWRRAVDSFTRLPRTVQLGTGLLGLALLAGVITLFLRQGNVTLKVELDDSLANDKVTFTVDGDTYAIGNLGQTIHVKPGKQSLEVRRGDEKFKTDEFTITRDEKPVLRISMVDEKLAVSRADGKVAGAPLAGTHTGHVDNLKKSQAGWHGWPADAPKPAVSPFIEAQAKKYQEEWASYLKLPVEHTNSIGMKFVLIPPGEFTMGSTQEEIEETVKVIDNQWQDHVKSEAPRHRVIVTQPIYLGVTEVTQAEFETVMGRNPSHFAKTGQNKQFVERIQGLDTSSHPVEDVSWNDAAEFCAKLSQQEKLKPLYFRAGETFTALNGIGYRLPTEAEREFACRAGTTTKFWIGDNEDDLFKAGWFRRNAGARTHAAGELKANPFGLYDIHGNVWEWVQDKWEPTYYSQFQKEPAIDPNGPSSGSQRVIRGGQWDNPGFLCRSSSRLALDPMVRDYGVGFRVALVAAGKNLSAVVREPPSKAGPPPSAGLEAVRRVQTENTDRNVDAPPGTAKVSPGSAPAKIGALSELNTSAWDIAAWVSQDGKRIYWEQFDEAGGKNLSTIWQAERTDASSPFGGKRVVSSGGQPTLTPDELQLVKIERDNNGRKQLCGASRGSIAEAFGPPTAMTQFAPYEVFNNPFISADGLMLYVNAQIGDDVTKQVHLVSRREDFEDAWGAPEKLDVRWNVPEQKIPLTWLAMAPDELSFLATHELEVGKFRVLRFTRNATTEPFTNFEYLTLPGIGTVYGRAARYAPATRELFVTAPPDYAKSGDVDAWKDQRSDLWVIRNVDLPREAVATSVIPTPAPMPTTALQPFDATRARTSAEAKAAQDAWAAQLKVTAEIENSVGMKLRLIPPGEYMCGSPDSDKDSIEAERPQHRVRITQAFLIGTHEVTRGQFRKYVEAESFKTEAERDGKGAPGFDPAKGTFQQKPTYSWKDPGFAQTDEHPVVNVTWNDAVAFCYYLSRKEKRTYRLPTEAEWEYACRAGSTTRYQNGDDSEGVAAVGNVADATARKKYRNWTTISAADGYVTTAPVGKFPPNGFGLFDMHGNGWEWCSDWFDPKVYAQFGAQTAIDPSGPPAGLTRVARGGSWFHGSRVARSAFRRGDLPASRTGTLGFRVVIDLSGK